jgi:hypothetical protein
MESNPINIRCIMKKIIAVSLAVILLVSCKSPESRKHKAYLYKQHSSDGLICIFYGSNKYVVEENARIFADMHEEKFGIPLTVATEPF